MSLATSCPSCGTVFKVVEDQLKVSEGWVRCGHCHDVFNALEGLFDLERRDSMLQGLRTLPGALDMEPAVRPDKGAPAADPTEATPPTDEPHAAPVAETQPATAPADAPAVDTSAAMATLQRPADKNPHPGHRQQDPAEQSEPPEQPTPADDEAEETLLVGDVSQTPLQEEARKKPTHADEQDTDHEEEVAPPSTTAATEEALIASTLAAGNHPEELPAFVLDAERRARWNRPLVRGAVTLAVLAGALLLAGQVAVHRRDQIAAVCESCQGPLGTLSASLGLTLRPPVVLEAVEVDNAVLTHPPGVDGYRLTVQVRNHSSHEVSAPHMELSLTDASGALLIRRVFSPQDFQQPPTLAAQAESSWTLEFQTTQKRVSGYTVAAFYP